MEGSITAEALDLRDVALEAVAKYLRSEGHEVVTAMSEGIGLIYVDGVGPMYALMVQESPSGVATRD